MAASNDPLEIALEALRRIAFFAHVKSCNSSAPVHECGCYDKDETEIAREALRKIEGCDTHEGQTP